MKVHLVNPSMVSFGTAVITPRWLYVLASATPRSFGDPALVDETLAPLDPASIQPGDAVGIGIHTANALRGYEIGRLARDRGAYVIFGGIHATLYPEEAQELGGAHAVVKGDGDLVWPEVLADCSNGGPQPIYAGGRIEGGSFLPGRWDLVPRNSYMWASVQTVRGCPKHCSFCSVWRTDGQRPRQRTSDAVIEEIVELRRRGFSFIALADDNFYPVTFTDLRDAERQQNFARLQELRAMRAERFELMARLAQLPRDMHFFTQITMEAAEDPDFLDAMKAARIIGALVGVESVTAEGLKDVYKDFNDAGDKLVERLRTFRQHGVHVLGSFIFGLPSDRPSTFDATAAVAERADLTFAQFVMLTPFPGTVDFNRWEKMLGDNPEKIAGVPITRRWLIPQALRPKLYWPHPAMSGEEIRQQTQAVWDKFYSWKSIWKRSRFIRSKRGRLAFMLISKIYRQMYADTGIATDSARIAWSARWARWMAKPCRRLFSARPMPDLAVPQVETRAPILITPIVTPVGAEVKRVSEVMTRFLLLAVDLAGSLAALSAWT
ncbi:MAG: B12-binding domain-containing radical SAM protein [Acidobacteria bacterium]|nr:B12-binding domain-containing radical SAM protein [Acidobacteriota bacterium]